MRVGGQTLDDKTGSGGAQRGTPLGCRGSEPGTCCRVCRPWLAQGWGCLSPPLIEDWALGCPVLLHRPLCRGLVLSHPRPPSTPHASARAPMPRQVCGWPPRGTAPAPLAEPGAEHSGHWAPPRHHSPEEGEGPDATPRLSCPGRCVEPPGHSCPDRNGRRSLTIYGGKGAGKLEER